MAIVVLQNGQKATEKNIETSREEHDTYIKITIDLKQKIVAIGGEYHADSERILIEKYQSNSRDIVGGGYQLDTKQFLTTAMINLRPSQGNSSMEILDSKKRAQFLTISKQIFND